jgi:flagellar hook protein FlgE
MYTGVSGLLANAEGINVIGNNLANVNTIGFKSGRMLFSDMLSTTIGNNSQIGHGIQIQKVDNVFSQGSSENTTSATDLMVQGDGFFALGGPSAPAGTAVTPANAYYTRAGSFRLDNSGLGLVNPDGYKVLDTVGMPIVFASTFTPAAGAVQNFQKVTGIDSTGQIALLYADAAGNSSTLYYAGATAAGGNPPVAAGAATIIKMAEAKVPNPPGMAKQGGTLFTLTAQSGVPGAPAIATDLFNSANGTNEALLSNNLELSNVDMASQFVNMITTQRAYSANSKTITTADQMTQEVLGLIR